MKTDLYTKLVSFLEKRGKIFLLLTVLLMISAVVGIVQVEIDTDFSAFMSTDSVAQDRILTMNEQFGDNDQLLVLAECGKSLVEFRRLLEVSNDLTSIDGIIRSELPLPETLLTQDEDDLDAVLEMIDRIGGGSLLSPREDGGYWAVIRLFLDDSSNQGQLIKDVEDVLEGTGVDYLISGESYLQGKIYSYVLRVLLTLPPLAILLLFLIFRIRIGSFRATALSLVPAVIGAGLTLGLMSWILGEISIMTALIPIFIIVLGSADGLHVTSHVIDRLRHGDDNRQAIIATLRAVGVPIIMTSVTTMAGFLSMMLIDSHAIREMGVGASIGIVFAGVATWIVLPILLLHQKPLPSHRKGEDSLVLRGFKKVHGWPSVVFTLVLLAVAIPGALGVDSDFSMLDMYKKSTEVRKNIDSVGEILGGFMPVMVMYPADSPLDPESEKAVLEFQREVEQLDLASAGSSIYSVALALVNSRTGATELPASRNYRDLVLRTITGMSPHLVSNFYSESGKGRAMFFLKDLDDETLTAFINLADKLSIETGVELEPVGNTFAMKEMNDKIVIQQVQSLVLAVILVLILSSLNLKSFKLGFLTALPVAITLVGLFGFMGYFGIKLSVTIGIMMGITVGVGIDYAIHYSALYKYQKKKGDLNPASRALGYVGTPILANAMGLSIGFSALALSPFQVHVTLTEIMWVTMVLSSFLSLSLLPTLLGIKREQKRSQGI